MRVSTPVEGNMGSFKCFDAINGLDLTARSVIRFHSPLGAEI